MSAPVFFVTGTDTDAGKTFVSALLTMRWRAQYWKPIQTGIEDDCGDTATVKKMCETHGYSSEYAAPKFELMKPLCPLEAMEYEPHIDVKLSDFEVPDLYNPERPLIVEGAGGVCVPITKKLETTVDLMKFFINSTKRTFKIVLVARSGLGTLNHTLMTIEHLKLVGLQNFVLGCVLSGKKNEGNSRILRRFGVKILAEIDHCETKNDVQRALAQIPNLEALF
ncbi:hypothetical protein HG535_0C06300 [Zygotorulaspora mrakii]|uniref:Dethiobiotin synthase n=1 Tax=Zygotorulaspora mrakii TaxID=42260 RepID=A0A7H9B0R5_ZYGMR|nr:uncharacterized protein HG535_0C06300 [Zygotorulaspora mrakii]QLG72275.1 hypothetical protein HG535_0C06300 [Zygotorulaspora mrakii]